MTEHIACTRCGTELAPHALRCPSCSALVHRDRLAELTAAASAAEASGELQAARGLWEDARALTPPASAPHRDIGERLSRLSTQLTSVSPPQTGQGARRWTGWVAAASAMGLLLAGKFKFLLLGLTKLSTATSMVGFASFYWVTHGWPLAVGMAGSIYIHEMGHVAALHKLGIRAGAPLFIPGVGALVMLKERITDPVADAYIGLAGPVWGLGAAIIAWALHALTGAPVWQAIAELTGLLNLFNLMPLWQLDGGRGFRVLTRWERGVVLGITLATLRLTDVKLLWLVSAVMAGHLVLREGGPGHSPTVVTFAGLVLLLAWFAQRA